MLKYFVQRNLKFSNFCNPVVSKTIGFNYGNLFANDIMKKYFFTRLFTVNYMMKTQNTLPIADNELIHYQKFFMRSMKSKRKIRAANTKYRIKNHTGLMKRIRVVGPRWDRQFKFYPTGNVHKMTNKSSANLKAKKKPRLISAADIGRVRRLIPYFKRRKCKSHNKF